MRNRLSAEYITEDHIIEVARTSEEDQDIEVALARHFSVFDCEWLTSCGSHTGEQRGQANDDPSFFPIPSDTSADDAVCASDTQSWSCEKERSITDLSPSFPAPRPYPMQNFPTRELFLLQRHGYEKTL